jgi:hypothetical protein
MPPDKPAPPPVDDATPPQQAEPAVGARQPSRAYGGQQLPAGTEIRATLDTPLSTKTSRVGDRFTATISQPIPGNSGGIAIPAGSKIHGEVVQAEEGKTLPALRGRGRLNLRFRDVTYPNGETAPLTATLVSVNETKGEGGSTAKTSEEGEVTSGTKGSTAAKDIGIGAGAGTVAGLVFGSALRGLAIGAIAGGGYVLAEKGKDVNLPAESGLVLRLDQPLNSPAGTSPR